MNKKLPVICFLGCGKIALKHAKILKGIYPDIKLNFASRDINNANEYVFLTKGNKAFGNYKEAIQSEESDIIFITTPHAYHSDLAVMAAQNKKHIIIEKPVTRNLKELIAIENAVKKNKVRCVVAENYYYKPFIAKIKTYINNGLIGDVLFIELNKTNKETISGWRSDKIMMGGGALLEGGVHWINALVSLSASTPLEVFALKTGVKYDSNIPVEDSILVNVKFENGIVAKLLHSWRIPNALKGMSLSKIYGTGGIITFESNGLFFKVTGKKNKLCFINPFDFLGFKAMHKSFVEDYINDAPWQPSLDRIKTEMCLIEAAYKSIKSGKLEKIS